MRKTGFCLLLFMLMQLTGCNRSGPMPDYLFQTSTIDALLAGVYDGEMTIGQLLTHGDFGIGTFDALDGEMVVLDGNCYQIRSDGHVYRPDSGVKTPFAAVCTFMPEAHIVIREGTTLDGLKNLLDLVDANQNIFYAIRIDGTFRSMKTRSVPRQKTPYPPLAQVTARQPEFEMSDVSGTLLGFRCPPFVSGLNVPGYHLHFISDDRMQGGHVLEFEFESGKGRIDAMDKFFLDLPEETEEFAATDLSEDRTSDLEQVE